MQSNDSIIAALLSEGRLTVDRNTGNVFAPRSNNPAKAIGAVTKKGYLRTCINYNGSQVYIMIHRVAWIDSHGVPSDPALQIDHKNTIKNDNRPDNLEAVPNAENMRRATAAGLFRHVGRRDGIRDSKGRFGKKLAGRLLDGRTWDEFPVAVVKS